MKRKRSFGDKVFDVVIVVIMLLVIIVMAYPLWYVMMASFSDSNYLAVHTGPLLYPLKFNVHAYQMAFKNPNIITGFESTILIVAAGTLSSTFFTLLAAYVMSRKPFPGKKFFMIMMVIPMYVSGGLIPSYILNNNWLHLGNNRLVLILPVLVVTYNMVILRTGLEAVPDSLEESARLDGASEIRILFQIVVPVAKASLAVVCLYYAVSYWNKWFDAAIYIRDRTKYPIQLILREILINNSTESMAGTEGGDALAIAESIKYATIMIATVPILCVYPFVQKYFVKGAMIGAVKG